MGRFMLLGKNIIQPEISFENTHKNDNNNNNFSPQTEKRRWERQQNHAAILFR